MDRKINAIDIKSTDTDYLTGLLNRRGLDDTWDSLPDDMCVHGIYIDVDNFKLVNDIYGHAKGDELLLYVAQILKRTFEGQIVVRMGGDEFVVVCDGGIEKREIAACFPVLQTELKNGGFDETIGTMLSFSIGVSYSQPVKSGLASLLQQCDEAMYHIKKNGKGSYISYDRIRGMVEENKALKDRALTAMENGEIQILLRPVIYLQTSEVYAAEVALYWKFPEQGILPEEKFMPIFEQYGVVMQTDAYVFEKVCAWKAGWRGTVFEHLDIYVRMSGLYLLKEEGLDHIRRCVERYRISPKEIKLCIEEKDFLESRKQLKSMLRSVMDMGFEIAINNFGSASSFTVLQDVPSRILKLDGKLCIVQTENALSTQILKNIISLGRDIRRSIVGQGIADAKQAAALATYGAQLGTGSFYGEALDEAGFCEAYKDRLYLIGNKAPVSFSFAQDLSDNRKKIKGEYIGDGLAYGFGVVASQRSLIFPGGGVKKNTVEFPGHLMHSDSYSVCLWVNPDEEQPWSSVVYIMYQDGFMSLVPNTDLGFCFRIKDDREPNVWYDILCRQAVPGEWSYICATYDMIVGVSRLYFNGLLVGSREDVPSLKVAQKVMLGGDEYQRSFRGKIAGLEFYHYVLSAEHIQQKFLEYQRDATFQGTDGRK